jgi:hypothetical protein
MTITAPGLGAPGLAGPGFGYQQGFSPGFPTPIGAEQFFGGGQHYHPQFRADSSPAAVIRDASRVDRLFQQILGSCRPLPDIGPSRSGAGIPNVAVAAGIAPWVSYPTMPEHSGLPGEATARSLVSEDPEAALAPLEAAMRSAGLINGVTTAI